MAAAGYEDLDLYADLYGEDEQVPAANANTATSSSATAPSTTATSLTTTTTGTAVPSSTPATSSTGNASQGTNATGGGVGVGAGLPVNPTLVGSSSSSASQAQAQAGFGAGTGQQPAGQHVPMQVDGVGFQGQQQQQQQQRNMGVRLNDAPDEGKMFIGGLNWDTTDESLRTYFEQYGKVTHSTIMRDAETGRSRGFAFLTFETPSSVNDVLGKEHYLDGKIIDPKRAVPRSEAQKSDKLFVRALPPTCTPESFRAYWKAYGEISDATLMMDKETGRHRGFGFVNYASGNAVEKVLASGPHIMDGQLLEVKRAQNKGEPRRPDYGINTNQFRSGMGGGGMHGGGGPGLAPAINPNGPMGQTPFDPAAMSKFFSQMGWGGAWNPMMMGGMMGGAGMGGMGGMPGMPAGGFGNFGMPGMGMGMGMGMPGMGMPGMGQFGGLPPTGPAGDLTGAGGSSAAGPGAGTPAPAAVGSGDAGSGQGQGPGVSQWTAPMAQPMRGGMGGGRGGRGGGRGGHFNPPTGPAAMRGAGGASPDSGAGPQRNRGGGSGFHPYSR